MSKLRLLEITFDKLLGDKAFLAYYLEYPLQLQNKSRTDIMQSLNCSTEDYYKLGLCKVPEAGPEFDDRIARIAEYSNVNPRALASLVRAVQSVEQTSVPFGGNLVPGIREKVSVFLDRLFPHWLFGGNRALPFGLSGAVMVLFIVSLVSTGTGTNSADFYSTGDALYRESLRGVAVQDDTFVATPYIHII